MKVKVEKDIPRLLVGLYDSNASDDQFDEANVTEVIEGVEKLACAGLIDKSGPTINQKQQSSVDEIKASQRKNDITIIVDNNVSVCLHDHFI